MYIIIYNIYIIAVTLWTNIQCELPFVRNSLTWLVWNFRSVLAIFLVIIIASTSYDIAKQGHLSTLNRGGLFVLLRKWTFYRVHNRYTYEFAILPACTFVNLQFKYLYLFYKSSSDVNGLVKWTICYNEYYIYSDRKDILLTSFSIYTNGKNLLKTDRRTDSIKCLDGLRYISICWIIYGHTHYTEVVGVKMNLNEISQVRGIWELANSQSSTTSTISICTNLYFLLIDAHELGQHVCAKRKHCHRHVLSHKRSLNGIHGNDEEREGHKKTF